MVRRAFWMVAGAVLGVWVVGKAQRAATRFTPSGALDAARRHVRHLGNDLAAALDEGRRAKRATEHELLQAARARPSIDVSATTALAPAGPSEELTVHR